MLFVSCVLLQTYAHMNTLCAFSFCELVHPETRTFSQLETRTDVKLVRDLGS